MKTNVHNVTKNTLILALSLLMGVSCLTACGNTKKKDKNKPAANQAQITRPAINKDDIQKPNAVKPNAQKPNTTKPETQKPDTGNNK